MSAPIIDILPRVAPAESSAPAARVSASVVRDNLPDVAPAAPAPVVAPAAPARPAPGADVLGRLVRTTPYALLRLLRESPTDDALAFALAKLAVTVASAAPDFAIAAADGLFTAPAGKLGGLYDIYTLVTVVDAATVAGWRAAAEAEAAALETLREARRRADEARARLDALPAELLALAAAQDPATAAEADAAALAAWRTLVRDGPAAALPALVGAAFLAARATPRA